MKLGRRRSNTSTKAGVLLTIPALSSPKRQAQRIGTSCSHMDGLLSPKRLNRQLDWSRTSRSANSVTNIGIVYQYCRWSESWNCSRCHATAAVLYKVRLGPLLKIFIVFLLPGLHHFSSSILLIKVPTPCETKTLNSSSCLSILRGLAFHPTPGGVLLVSIHEIQVGDIPS